MNIGRAIKFARAASGMSQQQLSSRLGISASYLSLVETGRKDPSLTMIRAVAKGLRISEDALLLAAIDYDAIRTGDVNALAALSEQLLLGLLRKGYTDKGKK